MTNIQIRLIQNSSETEICARMMANTDPWITLGRDYAACLQNILHPDKEVYVAVGEGDGTDEIAGLLVLNMHGAFVGYLQSICVAPQWQNRGVGTRLIAFAEERIFRDVPNVFLCVSSFNPGARRLYARLGYEVIGEIKDFMMAGYSEFLLRKTLGPTAGYLGR
ncbi:MAG: hypothetical protein BroJett018_29170 [Chloroflexota bacterium]|nr:MAG: hypothetical protein BroJett018_29170 [Chloroflexota bacterium]